MSSPPPPAIWPGPPPPGGTVIPFPLPWGQTGCCPPGGMDALMKCYCDIQQASAFIGQIMLDQINNNPAIIAAIIAGIEKSGSALPTVGVTNGTDAQPGQVGEYVQFTNALTFPAGGNTQIATAGTLPPGDWDCWFFALYTGTLSDVQITVVPTPAGFSDTLLAGVIASDTADMVVVSNIVRALTSAPSLIAYQITTNGASAPGNLPVVFSARRRR